MVGLAKSVEGIALPIGRFRREEVVKKMLDFHPSLLVVGKGTRDNTQARQERNFQSFVSHLRLSFPETEIRFQDEDLSTFEAYGDLPVEKHL